MKVLIGGNPMGLEKAIPDLSKKYPQVEFEYYPSRDIPHDVFATADVYVGWLNRDLYLAGKNLKWIQSPSSGVNYYTAIPELVASDVLLTSASGTHGACLAESVFGMIFAFTRHIKDFPAKQKAHEWSLPQYRPTMCELTGSTMGIIGFGRVGRAVAKRAVAFDMKVVAVDMFPGSKPDDVEAVWGLDKLNDLLAKSDYVVVTVPFTPETDNMLDTAQIALMKPTAMLIGISRGHIINEKALIAALKNKTIAYAALDVFDKEPLPADSELWDLDNLYISPHAAGGTQLEGQYIIEILDENIGRFLRGELPLRNQVDKNLGF
jgi:phosphoglycerate dehydrogenase-like enzyme